MSDNSTFDEFVEAVSRARIAYLSGSWSSLQFADAIGILLSKLQQERGPLQGESE